MKKYHVSMYVILFCYSLNSKRRLPILKYILFLRKNLFISRGHLEFSSEIFFIIKQDKSILKNILLVVKAHILGQVTMYRRPIRSPQFIVTCTRIRVLFTEVQFFTIIYGILSSISCYDLTKNVDFDGIDILLHRHFIT